MNKQEILQALDLPFPCSFSQLMVVCHNPDTFEVVLSLAIGRGEQKGRTETHNSYNQLFHGYQESVTFADIPTENLSRFCGPTFTGYLTELW